jgi:acyl carrier protein
MRPARFYLVDALPRLPSSKLDVAALAALDARNAQQERGGADAAPASSPDGSSLEAVVARAWLNALHAPVAGPEDDFFAAGGDSLKAIALTLELERALGVELPVTLINEAPRFAALCRALKEERRHWVPLVTLKPGEGAVPLFFVHGLGGNVVDLFPIARRMRYPGAVIGVQARGLAGEAAPHASVEAMAAAYLAELKKPAWLTSASGSSSSCRVAAGAASAHEPTPRTFPPSSNPRPFRLSVSRRARSSLRRAIGRDSILASSPSSSPPRAIRRSRRRRTFGASTPLRFP